MSGNNGRGIDIAIVAAALAGCYIFYKLSPRTWTDFFWDFDVYQRAVADAVLGYNPYREDVPLRFFYHPAVLYALLTIDRFIGLNYAFAGIYTAALLLFVRGYINLRPAVTAVHNFAAPGLPLQNRLLQSLLLQNKALALLAAFSFGASGVLAMITGNITLYLHLALIGATLVYLERRGTGWWFLVLAIFCCSLLVKPYFLIYALPLLLVERFSIRSIVLLTISILMAAAVYLWFWIFYRPHSLLFFNALAIQLKSGADLGISFFGLSANIFPLGVAFKIHLAISVALAGAVLFLRRLTGRFVSSGMNDGVLFLLAYGVITFCNPRMKEYDLVPALIGLYFYLSLYGRFGKSLIMLSLVVAQWPLWMALYSRDGMLAVFETHGYWEMAAVLLPLLFFFSLAGYRMKKDKTLAGIEG